jgi:signal transduction histidine kinase
MPAVPPLAAVAHELRTPLHGVLGCAALLERTALDAEQRAHLAALVEAARGALAFADDALALARLGAGRDGARDAAGAPVVPVRPAPCDPRAVLAGVARTLAPRAAARRLALACDVAPDVPADAALDAARVREVLLNLGANAVRVTRRGGVRLAARVERAAAPAGPAWLALDVADTGPGLTDEARARLFRAWATGGADGGDNAGGAGLGLVLARALAEHMGGALDVASVHGRGSTFTLRLPLAAAPL